jgi:hypothetical protein
MKMMYISFKEDPATPRPLGGRCARAGAKKGVGRGVRSGEQFEPKQTIFSFFIFL